MSVPLTREEVFLAKQGDLQEVRQRSHLEAFRKAYHDFPSGGLEVGKGQKPDCIVTITPDYKVGIEHTEFLRNIGKRGSPLKTSESLQEKVVWKAVKTYEQRCLPPVIVSLSWAPYVDLVPARVETIARGIADAVASNFPPSNSDQVKIEQTGLLDSSLPVEVNSIDIYRLAEVSRNQWKSLRADYPPEITATNLQSIIEKKEKKLPEYRKRCSTVWLLIVAEGLAPSSFGDIEKAIREVRFVTSFDQVFFFKFFDKEVIRLSLERRE